MTFNINEKDVRLLFDAGHWDKAVIKQITDDEGWQIFLIPQSNKHPNQILASKKGAQRLFKTSDSAIQCCRELGFKLVSIQFGSQQTNPENLLQPNNKSILLIENDKKFADIASQSFEKRHLNIKMYVVENNDEALELLFRDGYETQTTKLIPSLIIFNIDLCDEDGLNVVRVIRNKESTQAIPIVYLSCSKHPLDIVNAYKSGINSYIYKPTEQEHYSSIIDHLGDYWLRINTALPVDSQQYLAR